MELRASGDRLVATDRELVASLDPTITEELRLEGLARELVSLVQKARKNAGYDVEDRIQLLVKASPLMATAIRSSQGYIEEETLAEFVEAIPRDHHKETVQIESESVDLVLARVHQS